MSLHELTVEWPCYLAVRNELQRTLDALEDSASPEEFDQAFVGGNASTMSGGG